MTIDYTKPAEEIADMMLEEFNHIIPIEASLSDTAEEAIRKMKQDGIATIKCALIAVNLQLQVCPERIDMYISDNVRATFKTNPTYAKLQEVKQILENKLR